MIQIVLLPARMLSVIMTLSVACVLAQNTDIYFPGHTNTNTNSVHNVAAEINRNNVFSFIGEPGRVDIPERTNPFQIASNTGQSGIGLNAGSAAGGANTAFAASASGPTIGTASYPTTDQQRPQSNIRPVQNSVVANVNNQDRQGLIFGNIRPSSMQNRPVTNFQAPEVSFQSGQQIPVGSEVRVSPQPTNSVAPNSIQGFHPQTVPRQPSVAVTSTTLQQSPVPNGFTGIGQASPFVSFAYQLLVSSQTGTQNIVLSPILTQATLALLQYGAEGLTRKEIGDVVQSPLGAIVQILDSLRRQGQTPQQQTVIEYTSAVFTNNDSRLNRTFAAIAEEAKSGVVPVNFRDPGQTVKIINSWVSQATRRAIPSLLEQNADTRPLEMLLANAIYFKSNWKYAFRTTERGYFYKAQADRKEMTFIKEKQYFPTGSIYSNGRSGGAYWIEIPYAGEEFSMVILVPRFRDTLLSLISELSLSHVQTIINQLGAPSRQLVDLKMPKFDVETRTSLLGALRDMGLGRLFTAPSELVYINERQRPSVSDCVHNARLTVDETGTIAAAANAFSIIPLSISPPDPEVPFIVDQPFLAMIVDTQNKYPLFLAKIFDP